MILIQTTLYGLKSSGVMFHSRLSDTLTALVFVPSIVRYDTCIWDEGDYYSYVEFYCNDLIFLHKDPDCIFYSILVKGFTFKDTSAPEYFLCGNFECAKDPKSNNEILTWVSKTYVKHMMDNFKNTFGFDLFYQHSSMPPNFNPKL